MEYLIPILLGLGLLACVFGIRYLQNRENLLMIQNGMDPGLRKPKNQSYNTLRAGLLLMGSGIGLFLAYILDHTIFRFLSENGDDSVAVYFALIGIFGGLGLYISYLSEKKGLKEKD